MWGRIDDGWWSHPKVVPLSLAAAGLWSKCLSYCSSQLTDGHIPRAILPMICGPEQGQQDVLVKELVDSKLWEAEPSGWRFHDYHDYNPLAEDVRKSREQRANAGKKGGQKSASKRLATAQATAQATNGECFKQNPTPSRPVPSPSGSTTEGLPTLGASGTVPLLVRSGAPAPHGAALQVQEPEQPGKKGQPARHVGPETPPEGLDQIDLCRRGYARLWASVHGGNGAVYPDKPGADRDVIGGVLGYHRRTKIEQPWRAWMTSVFTTYLKIQDDRLVVSSSHALRHLTGCLPRVVTKVAEDAAQQPQEEKQG